MLYILLKIQLEQEKYQSITGSLCSSHSQAGSDEAEVTDAKQIVVFILDSIWLGSKMNTSSIHWADFVNFHQPGWQKE